MDPNSIPKITIQARPGSTPGLVGHTADWHLSPTHQHRRSRGEDFLRAALSSLETAVQQGCGALLVGGDILHNASNQPIVLNQLRRLDTVARDHGMPVLVIDGNHDRMDPSWFEVLSQYRGDHATAQTGLIACNHKLVSLGWDERALSILGVPACSFEELLAFTQSSALPASRLDILLWHGAVQELMGYPDPSMPTLRDMPLDRFRAILMGDIHQRGFRTEQGCLIGYPGSTETYKRDDELTHSMTVVDMRPSVPTETRHPIWHRLALAYRIETEAQLQHVITELKTKLDESPVVFIRYDRLLGDVLSRLYTAIDPERMVLRPAPLPPVGMDHFRWDTTAAVLGKQPVDFIPSFFSPGTPLADLAGLLCRPDAEHARLLIAYQQTKLDSF